MILQYNLLIEFIRGKNTEVIYRTIMNHNGEAFSGPIPAMYL